MDGKYGVKNARQLYTGSIPGGDMDLTRCWFPGDMIRVNGMMRWDQANQGKGKAAAGGCCSYWWCMFKGEGTVDHQNISLRRQCSFPLNDPLISVRIWKFT
jgi:hypothetical protein